MINAKYSEIEGRKRRERRGGRVGGGTEEPKLVPACQLQTSLSGCDVLDPKGEGHGPTDILHSKNRSCYQRVMF